MTLCVNFRLALTYAGLACLFLGGFTACKKPAPPTATEVREARMRDRRAQMMNRLEELRTKRDLGMIGEDELPQLERLEEMAKRNVEPSKRAATQKPDPAVKPGNIRDTLASLPPAERAAKLKEIRVGLEQRVTALQQKQKAGTLTDDEKTRLEQMQKNLERMDQRGANWLNQPAK
jgi:hypothetical protein